MSDMTEAQALKYLTDVAAGLDPALVEEAAPHLRNLCVEMLSAGVTLFEARKLMPELWEMHARVIFAALHAKGFVLVKKLH